MTAGEVSGAEVSGAEDLETDHENHEKCTRQLVLNVARNVKFRSSQQKEEKFFAVIVLRTEENSNS